MSTLNPFRAGGLLRLPPRLPDALPSCQNVLPGGTNSIRLDLQYAIYGGNEWALALSLPLPISIEHDVVRQRPQQHLLLPPLRADRPQRVAEVPLYHTVDRLDRPRRLHPNRQLLSVTVAGL